MSRLRIALVFVVFAVISTTVFFPYRKFYSSVIRSLEKRSGVQVSCRVDEGSPLGVHVSDVRLILNGRMVKIDGGSVRLHPIGYIFGGVFASFELENGDREADFQIKRNRGGFEVTGVFPTAILKPLVNSEFKPFLAGFKGKNTLYAFILHRGDRIVIRELKISGTLGVTAHGYVDAGKIRLVGVVRIGKWKGNFSL